MKESPAGAHVECLPAVYLPTREIRLLPATGDGYDTGGMKDLSGDAYLISYIYPVNVETHSKGGIRLYI